MCPNRIAVMFGDMSERSLSQVMRQSSDWVGSSSQRIHPLGSWRVFSDGMLAEIGVHLERVFREFVAIVGNELREHVWIQICWNLYSETLGALHNSDSGLGTWEFPKIRGTLFRGNILGSPIFGKPHMPGCSRGDTCCPDYKEEGPHLPRVQHCASGFLGGVGWGVGFWV